MAGKTVILGGGISGLSAAYYSLDHSSSRVIKLIEAGNRTGGWVRSRVAPSGAIFEEGPRTVRPRGPAGQNTLTMIEALGLKDKVIPIKSDHPAAKNRMIYAHKKLHLLPNSLSGLFRVNSPFDKPLIGYLLRDLTAPRSTNEDESMYTFVERRFGTEIADYLISPMICGICAGNAKEISINFLMPTFMEAEKRYGSVAKAMLMGKLKSILESRESPEKKIESDLGRVAVRDKWSIWSLEGGLEQFPRALTEHLHDRGVSVTLNAKCDRVTFHDDHVELRVNGETERCSHLVSSLPAKSLAGLIQAQHPQLAEELQGIPSVDVAVVNLEFAGNVMSRDAFGFLVPPREKLPILGCIFDSCVFPKKDSTVLTVMMGGAWFRSQFGESPSEEHLLAIASRHVKEILEIGTDPVTSNVAILKDCIPQHVVGHVRRVERIQNYISKSKLPLAVCGSSYQGVGLNDVILSARAAVSSLR